MRLAVIADIHSNIQAFEAVLQEIKAEKILCAGDLTGYYLHPGEVIGTVKEKGIDSVLGNHDRGILDWPPTGFNPFARRALEFNRERLGEKHIEYLKSLPTRRDFELEGRMFTVVHGSPSDPDKYVYPGDVDQAFVEKNLEQDCDILIMGHTHVPFTEKFEDTVIMNPGSVGQPRDGDPRASYAVIDTGEMEVEIERVEYEVDKVVDEVEESSLSDRLGERLRKGR